MYCDFYLCVMNHHQLLVVFVIVSDDMNIPISIISRALGHNSEATTQIYLNTINGSQVDDANAKIIADI